MAIRDLLRLLLKLFGLYALVINLFSVISSVSFLSGSGAFTILGYLFVALALFAMFLYLAFKPDVIIDALRLDKGFENNTIDLRIDGRGALKVGLIIIAGLFFVRNFSHLLMNTYYFVKNKVASGSFDDYLGMLPSKTEVDIIVPIINLVVSWLIITNVERLSEFLFRNPEEVASQSQQ